MGSVRLALALVCACFAAALLPTLAGAASSSFVTITAGPAEGENVPSNTVTFAYESSSPATFACVLDGAAPESCDGGQITYTELANGSHTFTVIATTTGPDVASGRETRNWTVAVAPVATITSEPPNPSESPDATFEFTSDQAGATFECSLDGAAPAACTSPAEYHGLSEQEHVFAVRAVDPRVGNGPPAEYRWAVKAAPPTSIETSIVAAPPDPSASPDATFSFAASVPGATFRCALDGGIAKDCTSPVTYSGLAGGKHSFTVAASNGDVVDDTPADHSWTIALPQPLDTRITGKPSDPSDSADATFEFTSNRSEATFECSLDGAGLTSCTSPITYERLSNGGHSFEVRAVKGSVLDESPAQYRWGVEVASSSSGTPWVWIVVGIAAALLVAGGVYYLLRRRRRTLLVAWQAAAVTEAPPERCHGDGDHVWRRGCKLKPALRHVEAVLLRGTTTAGDEIRRATSVEIADGLNRAVEAWRLRRGRDTLLETLDPVALLLLRGADAWTEARSGGKVTIDARLSGGKLECEFKRFRCVAEGQHRVWKPADTWRAKVEDEPEEVIGEIHVATGVDWAEQSAALAEALLAFVQQVDVPGVERPPEASPVVNP